MGGYKEATGQTWKPEKEEDFIEGILTKVEYNIGPNSSTMYHVEQLGTNEMIRLWGTTILDMRMSEVKVGQQVKITYKGISKEKPKGGKQAPHIWKVEYKDIDVVEAAKEEFGDF